MPGHLFCNFGPSNFPATAILKRDDVVHCRAQAPAKSCKEKWRMKESSLSNLFDSFKPECSSDNQSYSSSDEVQSGEDESNRFSVTNKMKNKLISTCLQKEL